MIRICVRDMKEERGLFRMIQGRSGGVSTTNHSYDLPTTSNVPLYSNFTLILYLLNSRNIIMLSLLTSMFARSHSEPAQAKSDPEDTPQPRKAAPKRISIFKPPHKILFMNARGSGKDVELPSIVLTPPERP